MSEPTEAPSRARSRGLVAGAVVVTLAAAAASGVGLAKLLGDGGAPQTAASAGATTALADGGQLAVDFTSFDYRTLSQDFQRTAAHATASFAKTYLAQSRAVASLIRKAKAVSTSHVVSTGLSAYSPGDGTATVMVALDETTKNTRTPSGTVQYYRMQVQMVRQNGAWLAAGVTPV